MLGKKIKYVEGKKIKKKGGGGRGKRGKRNKYCGRRGEERGKQGDVDSADRVESRGSSKMK